MSLPKLTDAQVIAIRVSGYTDTYWAQKLRVQNQTIRSARKGLSYQHVQAAPDRVPREGAGCTHAIRAGLPQKAIPARVRRQWRDL